MSRKLISGVMSESKNVLKDNSFLYYTLSFLVAWTLLIVSLGIYELSHIHNVTLNLAISDARSYFKKEHTIRTWASSHGGVYVPISDNTLPSEYLTNLPERDITTPSGKKLTLLNPDYMIRQIGEVYANLYSIAGHITSLKPLRPENAPDEWETKALKAFNEGKTEVLEFTEIDGDRFLRIMQPIPAQEKCLDCHGFKGHNKKDIWSGASVSIPMASYLEKESIESRLNIFSFFILWILGTFFIYIGAKKFKQRNQERKRAEEALKLDEERLESLLKIYQLEGISERELIDFALEEGVRLTGSKVGYFHFYNEAQNTLQLFTWSKEALNECTLQKDVKHSLENTGVWADAIRFRKPVIHNDYQNMPHKKSYPEGHLHIISHMSVPIFYDNQIVAIVGVANKKAPYDKSDIRQLTLYMNSMWSLLRQMRMEEERKKDYLNLVGVIVIALNDDKTVSFINNTGCEILGHKREEIIGKNWFDNFVPERSREEAISIFNESMVKKTDLVEHYESPILNKDGEEKIVRWNNTILKDNTGDITGILVAGEDITDKKLVEKALQNIASGVVGATGDEVLRSLVKYLAIVLEADYTFIGVKEEGKNIIKTITVFGKDKIMDNFKYDLANTPCEKVLGEDICFFPSNVRKIFPNDKFLAEKEIESYIGASLIDSEGKRFGLMTAMSCKPLKKPEIAETLLKIFAVRAKSELERMLIEKEKIELWKQLLQSQKMESIGRLTGGIAHDFNNLLTGILGYCELVTRDIADTNHPAIEKIEVINESGRKAAKLIRQLLAFSRKQVLDMKISNLNTIVEHMGNILTRIIRENINLELNIKNTVRNVLLDETQIEQVLINLAVNARDAMPAGGRLMISTEDIEIDEEYARNYKGMVPGSYVLLSVEDVGTGMTPEVKERIFEPFFTTKEKEEGSGLGLSTVFGIVKQHNGYIWIDSELGKGSIFKIYFPVAEGEATVRKEEKPLEIKMGDETILMADDDKIVRKLALNTFIPLGYKVLEAKSGEQALNFSSNYQGKIHILLTDVIMTGMNGWELYKKIKDERPDMKVVFTSGYSGDPIVIQNITSHGIPFIHKPFTPSILSHKIREVLDEDKDEDED